MSSLNHTDFTFFVSLEDINKCIYQLTNHLKKLSEKHWLSITYGYYDPVKCENEFYDLSKHLDKLYDFRFRFISNSCCYSYDLLAEYLEMVRSLAKGCSTIRLDLIEDSSRYEEWVLNNPSKVARETWEECLFHNCNAITYTLARDLTKSQHECELIYSLIKSIHECNISFNLQQVDTDKCALEYNLLQKEMPNCGISYSLYSNLRNCGISYETILYATNCDASFNINMETRCVTLTYNLEQYPLNCHE